MQAASPLLLLTAQLRETLTPMDVPGLRRHALEEIRRFEEQARSVRRAETKVVLSARYALCAGLDEAVLVDAVGPSERVGAASAVGSLHREAWGGEKFFDMLEGISQDPARYIDLMELQYLALAFGFAGKYAAVHRSEGHERLLEVQQDLYRKIREHRGATDPELSLRWRGLEDRRNPLHPLHAMVGGRRGGAADPRRRRSPSTTRDLAQRRRSGAGGAGESGPRGLFTAARRRDSARSPTLKQLLAADEQAGRLQRGGAGSRTRVTLLAPDLFPSGSATVNPTYVETLERITGALNKVPGRVLVVGHTDDQPIRSLRYSDNNELSRERAVRRGAILRRRLDGRGATERDRQGPFRTRVPPSRIRRTARAIGGWKSSTCREPDVRNRSRLPRSICVVGETRVVICPTPRIRPVDRLPADRPVHLVRGTVFRVRHLSSARNANAHG